MKDAKKMFLLRSVCVSMSEAHADHLLSNGSYKFHQFFCGRIAKVCMFVLVAR